MKPQHLVFLLCSLTVLLDGFDVQAMALAVPAMSSAWGLSPPAFSSALATSVLGLGLGAAFLAPLGDRFGRRPVLIACTALLGLSSLATALATDMTSLALLRLVTGMALGACQGNATALMSDFAPPGKRAWTLTLMGCNVSIGALGAGFVAPWLVAGFGWQGIFVAGGVLPLLLSFLLFVLLPEADLRAPAPAAAAPPPAEAPRKVGLRGLLAPDMRGKTLLLWAIYSLNTFLIYMVMSWLPTLLGTAGWDSATALRSVMAFHLGGIVGALALAVVMDRGRPTTALVAGFTIAGVAAALFAFVPPTVPAWAALLALLGAGISGTTFAVFALGAIVYPSSIRASAYGWLAAVARIGAVIGPLAGGALLAFNVAPHLIMAGLAVPALLCAALSLRVRRTIGGQAPLAAAACRT
ncbi:MAG: 4-hydroxybenzoate transporter [Sphingomonas bacterium]|nr:4-hydroxybenzoate transporter [Sphingomonas bacterium]